MSDYLVSARKYRPTDFSEVVGQSSVTTTLAHAISSGKLAHAYLFCGPRGVGKTTCARIFARIINHADDAADLSFNVFELDAASNNSVDDIRSLIEQVRIPPQSGTYKVYIIDEVHMLSAAAFNAFLKTLEEPPAHAIFVLATTEKHKILPTILSRCQIYDFNRIGIKDMAGHLAHIAEQEGISAERDALLLIARKADGALRDALTIFDQLHSFSGGALTSESVSKQLNILDTTYYSNLFGTFLEGNASGSLLLLDEILGKGFDCLHFIQGIAAFARDLLVCSDPSAARLFEGTENARKVLVQLSSDFDGKLLISAIDMCNTAEQEYRISLNQRLRTELLLLQLVGLFGITKKKYGAESPLTAAQEPTGAIEQQDPEKKQVATPPATGEKAEAKQTPGTEPAQENDADRASGPARKPKMPENRQQNANKEDSGEAVRLRTPEELIDYTVSEDSISLSKTMEVPDPESQTESKGTVPEQNESFEPDALINAWNEFALQVKKNGKDSLHATLTCRKPFLSNGNQILFKLDNKVQEGDFELEKQALLQYLRQRLKNTNITLGCEVIGNTDERSGRPYTTREKFNHLAKKNPALEILQQQLNLDIDY